MATNAVVVSTANAPSTAGIARGIDAMMRANLPILLTIELGNTGFLDAPPATRPLCAPHQIARASEIPPGLSLVSEDFGDPHWEFCSRN